MCTGIAGFFSKGSRLEASVDFLSLETHNNKCSTAIFTLLFFSYMCGKSRAAAATLFENHGGDTLAQFHRPIQQAHSRTARDENHRKKIEGKGGGKGNPVCACVLTPPGGGRLTKEGDLSKHRTLLLLRARTWKGGAKIFYVKSLLKTK